MPRKIFTPWGESQDAEQLGEGIVFHSTASHGGIHVDPAQNSLIHAAWRNEDGWYEEDCEWAVVAFHYPFYFKSNQVQLAISVLKNDHYKQYEEITGVKVTESESRQMRDDLWQEKHKDHLQVTAAFGDWAEGVPPGMVGVVVVPGNKIYRKTNHYEKLDERYFLVPKSEYTIPFAIEDPLKYQEVKGFGFGKEK